MKTLGSKIWYMFLALGILLAVVAFFKVNFELAGLILAIVEIVGVLRLMFLPSTPQG